MHHRFTLWLPPDYRRRGDDLVAVSVFQWHDDYYWRGPSGRGTARLQLADDGVGEVFALLWLDDAEFSGARTARPATAEGEGDGGSASRPVKAGPLRLVERDDPNAGLAPVDFPGGDNAYVDVEDRYSRFGMEHLGGTAMNPDGIREGVSAWYVEVNGLGGLNHGGDSDIAFDGRGPHAWRHVDACARESRVRKLLACLESCVLDFPARKVYSSGGSYEHSAHRCRVGAC
jgi:hypothetical protein